jgi:serine protease
MAGRQGAACVALSLALLAPCAAVAQRTAAPEAPTDRLIVKWRAGSAGAGQLRAAPDGRMPLREMARIAALAGIDIAEHRAMSGDAQVIRLSRRRSLAEARTLAAQLARQADIEYAVPDQKRFPFAAANDDYFDLQASLPNINVHRAWEVTTGAPNVVVAVIDTGILPHPDLAGRVLPGYDLVSDPYAANDGGGRDADAADPGDWVSWSDVQDPNSPFDSACLYEGIYDTYSSWHGTHMAGIIGAAANNDIGIAGINWSSKILPVRALGKCGGYDSDIIDAMRWAAGLPVPGVLLNPTPARVLNMSLGGPGACNAAYQSAIDQVVSVGKVVVVAAGNEGIDYASVTPASCQGVVAVGAFTEDFNHNVIRSFYSNFASGPAPNLLVAPGDKIHSTSDSGFQAPNNDGIIYSEYGTSGAAAHVSGIVSLMLSANPALTHAQVLQILRNSSRAVGEWAGSGKLDALQAVGNAAAFRGGGPVPVTLAINGPSEIFEFVVAGHQYTATVTWSDSSVTPAYPHWSMTSSYSPFNTMSEDGVLAEQAVTQDETVTVHASFTANGVTVTADKAVAVLDKYLTSLQVVGPDTVFLDSPSPAKFRALATWRDGQVTGGDVTWSVTEGSGSISSSGLFLGTGLGPATVQATNGSVSAQALVNVVAGSGAPPVIAWDCASESLRGLTPGQIHAIDVGASANIVPLCDGQVVVGDRLAKRIDVIDVVSAGVVHSWSLGEKVPLRMERAAGSSKIFVTLVGAASGMAVIDLAAPSSAPQLIGIPGETGDMASGPNGEMWVLHSQFYFFPQGSVKLSRFSVSDGALIQTHDLPRAGGHMKYSKPLRILVIADSTSGGVRTSYDVPDVPPGSTFTLPAPREHLFDGGGVLRDLSPDGRRLLLNGRDLDVADLRSSRGTFAGTGAGAFSPDGRTLFAADSTSNANDLVLFSVESHAPLKRFLKTEDCSSGSFPVSAGFSATGAYAFAIVFCGGLQEYSRLFWIPLGAQPTPDVFRFEARTGVAPGALVTSDAVTVAGFEGSASIGVTGGEYSVDGGETFTAAAGTVAAGQSLQVRVQAPAHAYATASATLSIGHLSVPFFATTGAALPADWWDTSCASEADLAASAVQYLDVELATDFLILCDGRVLVANSTLNRIELLDVRARGVIAAWPLTASPQLLRLVPGTSLLLVITNASSITRLDLATGAQAEIPVRGRPRDVAVGEPGEIMVLSQSSPTPNIGGSDTFSVHEISSAAELGRQSAEISLLRYYPSDRILIAGNNNRFLRYSYDPASHGITLLEQTPSGEVGVPELVIANDRSRIASILGGQPSSVAEWNPQDFSAKAVGKWLTMPFPRSADFRADGAKLLVGLEPMSPMGTGMSLFDVASRDGERHWALPHCQRHHLNMLRVRFSPSGAYAFALERCRPQVTDTEAHGRVFWIAGNAASSMPVPDPVTIVPRVNAPLSTDVYSDYVQITGLKGVAVPINVTGGYYQLQGDNPSSFNSMVQDGYRLRLVNSSSSVPGVTTTTTVNIGGTLLHFNVTTGDGGADTTPDPFRLFVLKRRELDTEFESNTFAVTGIDAPAPISVIGGSYRIGDGEYTAAPGLVSNGQLVTVKLTTANAKNTTSAAILTIGGVSASLTVTTGDTDTTPDAFAFAPRPRVPRERWIESAPVTMGGLDSPAAVRIAAGEYRIGGGLYTAAPGVVSNGQQVRVRVMSSGIKGEAAIATLTVGPRSADFVVTTGGTARTDLSGDGLSDVLWRNLSSGENYLFPMSGTAVLGTEGYLRRVPDLNWQVAGTGDFDGNGSADILWRHAGTGQNYVYLMNGAAIAGEGYVRTVPNAWQVAGVGDFDDDGKDDVLWRNGTSGENYLFPMDGLAIKASEGYLRTVAGSWQVAGVGDFNGDGTADILWRNAATGQNYLYLMNGRSIVGEGYARSVAGPAWQVKGIGDFDGDGKADVLWRHGTSGENYLFPMDGLAIKPSEGYVRTVASPWQIAATGDYDGDGKADVLWRNGTTGQNYLFPMDGKAIKPNEGYVRAVPPGPWSVQGK